ncbi:MAG: ABC transporter permease [Gemmatimonadales bacterium]|jgi:phospholipid/cholesterol/gamma-HCH transport system permease protein
MQLTGVLAWVGRQATAALALVGRAAEFVWSILRSIGDVKTWVPLTPQQVRQIGIDSVPVALFIALFTGIVLALQSSYTFTGIVPLYFVGVLVAKSIMLELGPVLTGLALAGRVGANIAAEVGTMRVTEQIDALEMMAWNPVSYLVVPRVVAGVIAFPIVTALALGAGIAAGWITSISLLDLSTQEFIRGVRMFYDPFDIRYPLIKAASFGAVVTMVGALHGYHTSGGAAGVGRATTRSVVLSCMLILVLDAVWAVILL